MIEEMGGAGRVTKRREMQTVCPSRTGTRLQAVEMRMFWFWVADEVSLRVPRILRASDWILSSSWAM